MAEIGIFFSTEERGALEIVEGAQRAEQAGFRTAWVSDHFHPWNSEQGQSPFVWSVLAGLAVRTELRVHTAVTCPTMRIHPAIVAQAAATTATMMPGRFGLGVGTGEALNEHIFGDPWPATDVRLEMLEEAIEVMRLLWEGGVKDHDGVHYHLENAHLFSLPDEAPPIHVSGFGPKAVSLAARVGDGYMTVGPGQELLEQYRAEGGQGTAHTGLKVCWAADRDDAIDTAYRLWPNEALPGELAQILPTVSHFEQATELVTRDMIAQSTPCGPDPETHVAAIQEHVDAGFDEVYVSQIGPDQEGFFAFYEREVLPHFA